MFDPERFAQQADCLRDWAKTARFDLETADSQEDYALWAMVYGPIALRGFEALINIATQIFEHSFGIGTMTRSE